MRCSACFADIEKPANNLRCVVCKLSFHVRCTSWKNMALPVVMRLKRDWQCIFCRKNLIKRTLFLVDNTSIDIRQENRAKRNAKLSAQNFTRKLVNIQTTNMKTTFLLDDMSKSLRQVKTSVGSLSDFNMQCACDNVKIKKIIGDMTYKLENLCLV